MSRLNDWGISLHNLIEEVAQIRENVGHKNRQVYDDRKLAHLRKVRLVDNIDIIGYLGTSVWSHISILLSLEPVFDMIRTARFQSRLTLTLKFTIIRQVFSR